MSNHKRIVVDFTTSSPQTGCRLLGLLPPELKNHIYELALKDTTMELFLPTSDKDEPLCKAPGLLLACKEIHRDTLKMFYSTVTVIVPLDKSSSRFETTSSRFENTNDAGRQRLDKFLSTIGTAKSALLASMRESPAAPALHDPQWISSYRTDDIYLKGLQVTIQQKIDLIDHAKTILGRSLLDCWFKMGADGKPEYSKDPVQSLGAWSAQQTDEDAILYHELIMAILNLNLMRRTVARREPEHE